VYPIYCTELLQGPTISSWDMLISGCMDELKVVLVCYNPKYGTMHTMSSYIFYITHFRYCNLKSSHGLIWDTILVFAWRDWWNSWKPSVRMTGLWSHIWIKGLPITKQMLKCWNCNLPCCYMICEVLFHSICVLGIFFLNMTFSMKMTMFSPTEECSVEWYTSENLKYRMSNTSLCFKDLP
jgi:hypothetical protein